MTKTICKMKARVEEFTGCVTPNFLKFQFDELKGKNASQREFWIKAVQVVEERYMPTKQDHPPEVEIEVVEIGEITPATSETDAKLKADLSAAEKGNLAKAIGIDSFGVLNVKPEKVKYVVVVGDMYFIYYHDDRVGKNLCHPIHDKAYRRYINESAGH